MADPGRCPFATGPRGPSPRNNPPRGPGSTTPRPAGRTSPAIRIRRDPKGRKILAIITDGPGPSRPRRSDQRYWPGAFPRRVGGHVPGSWPRRRDAVGGPGGGPVRRKRPASRRGRGRSGSSSRATPEGGKRPGRPGEGLLQPAPVEQKLLEPVALKHMDAVTKSKQRAWMVYLSDGGHDDTIEKWRQ